MNSAQERAQDICRRYHFSDLEDIEGVLRAEKLSVVRIPFVGRIDEMIFNYITLQSSLSDSRRIRESIAHALGHYFLHAGDKPFYYFRGDRTLSKQWEWQA